MRVVWVARLTAFLLSDEGELQEYYANQKCGGPPFHETQNHGLRVSMYIIKLAANLDKQTLSISIRVDYVCVLIRSTKSNHTHWLLFIL